MTTPFIADLAAVAARAPFPDNSQTYRLVWDGTTLGIDHVARHAATNVFSAYSHGSLLSIGALAENIDQALAHNGVSGTWQWESAQDAGPRYGAVTPGPLPATFQAPPAVVGRHTNRLPYRSDVLPPDLLARIDGAQLGGNRVTVLTAPAQKKVLVGLIKASSEARFCNHALHRWLFGSLRDTPEEVARGDGLDLAALGLPPGGKSMLKFMANWERLEKLNRLGAYKLLAASETGLVSKAPALVCLTGPSDHASVIAAGRLLTRTWTDLNAAGLAVHPYYVVTDQLNRLHDGTLADGFAERIGDVERTVAQLLALGAGQQLHMILRVGFPKGTPVRSRRLPPDATFTDVSGQR